MKRITLMAFLAFFSFCAAAQAVTDDSATKPAAKKAESKKAEPKKVEAKKPTPPKKPVAPKRAQPPTKVPETRVYRNDPNAPVLYDKQGNAIPTNPNAYDVSSAVGKK